MSSTMIRSVRWSLCLALEMLVAVPFARSAEPAKPLEGTTASGPVKLTAQEDHKRMMTSCTSHRCDAGPME